MRASEATNCFSLCRRDIHILVANRKGAAKNEQVVLEVTPNLRDWAAKRGIEWSEQNLKAQLVGRWCEFEGWLYFDLGHTDQSENTAPHNVTNWRNCMGYTRLRRSRPLSREKSNQLEATVLPDSILRSNRGIGSLLASQLGSHS